jgi:thioredoxin 1
MAQIIEIESESNFQQRLASAGELLVVVDFYVAWSGSCKNIDGKLEVLADKYDGKILILKVDIDKCWELKVKHEIKYAPTFKFFWNGEKLDGIVDEGNAKKVESLIVKYLESCSS